MSLASQLNADLTGILSYDLPKTIVVGGSTVTGLVEDVKREEQNELGGYNLTFSTRVHIQVSQLAIAPTIGLVITVDGASKRVVSYAKALDDNLWMIDVDDPG